MLPPLAGAACRAGRPPGAVSELDAPGRGKVPRAADFFRSGVAGGGPFTQEWNLLASAFVLPKRHR